MASKKSLDKAIENMDMGVTRAGKRENSNKYKDTFPEAQFKRVVSDFIDHMEKGLKKPSALFVIFDTVRDDKKANEADKSLEQSALQKHYSDFRKYAEKEINSSKLSDKDKRKLINAINF